MSVRATVTMSSNLARFVDALPEKLTSGQNAAAERLLALSSAVAPFDTGTLVGSGMVENATTPEAGAAVIFDTPYAARLHEHPEYNFQGGRQGKYVEEPAVTNRAELGDIIRAKVQADE